MTTFNNIRARIAATTDGYGPSRLEAKHSTRAHAEPPWVRALRIRSEGLNRLYGLD